MNNDFFNDRPRSVVSLPETATNHAGEPIAPDMDFFVAPPVEIGPIVSVYSTLKKGLEPRSWFVRLGIALTIIAVWVLLVELLILPNVNRAEGRNGLHVVCVIVSLIILGVVIYVTRFKHTCSYVGEQGLARYTLKSSRDNVPIAEILPFRAATDLRTKSTRHYHNGIYTGTQYNFTWTDLAGQTVYKLAGQYSSKEGFPKAKSPYHFARMGEIVWSGYLFDSLADQLEKNGHIQFNLTKQDWLRIGPGFMECSRKGAVARIQREEMREAQLADGMFTVYHHDARWYSSAGKYSFDYGTMANGRLFLIAWERLVGLPL